MFPQAALQHTRSLQHPRTIGQWGLSGHQNVVVHTQQCMICWSLKCSMLESEAPAPPSTAQRRWHVVEQGHCLNCGETTHESHSLSVSRTVCAALRHAYVARPCTRFLLAPFEFASTHCVPEVGHCVPCARSRWNIGRPLLHECTTRTVLHIPAAFPWAATAGQRPSARLPTQPGPGAGPIATERVGAAGSSTPRGASASRTVNDSPSPRASSRTHSVLPAMPSQA